MKKLLIVLILFMPSIVYAFSMPEINSDAAIIYDLDREKIILDKNSNIRSSVASLTKILTTITAIENISDLDQSITITDKMLAGIYWNASVAGLKVGDTVTYRDLLYAVMLPSGADAAQVLALALASDVPSFVAKMNNLASKIDMNDSHFVNVTGLDQEGNYSTAHDILILLKYALSNETFKDVYMAKVYKLSNGLEVKSTIQKYNEKLNIDLSRILGSKTGFTDDAGLCLSSLVKSQDHNILIVTLGAQYEDENVNSLKDNLTLINYLDENYIVKIPALEEFFDDIAYFAELCSTPSKGENNLIIYISGLIVIIGLSLVFGDIIYKKKRR